MGGIQSCYGPPLQYIEHYQQNCCCETKGLIKEVKSDLALPLERCCYDIKNG